nr:hypothetical protein [Tanacetum cinerariifolium]
MAKVESSDEESLANDASKLERRIDDIYQNEDITLVNVHNDVEMFDVNGLCGEEVLVAKQDVVKKRRKHFAVKRAKEKRNKPPTQAQKRKIMCTYLKNMEGYKLKQLKSFELAKIQDMFNRAFKRVNTFEPIRSELVERKEKRAGEELIQERTKKQKVEEDKEMKELNQLMEIIHDKEESAIDAIPLVVKSPMIVDWKIYKE